MELSYVKLYSGSFIIIQPICRNLESQGISPIIKDESESARLAGFGISNYGNQEIFVHINELKQAEKILATTLATMGA
jgi:hypothetical protein